MVVCFFVKIGKLDMIGILILFTKLNWNIFWLTKVISLFIARKKVFKLPLKVRVNSYPS